jgi:hypothetical protein
VSESARAVDIGIAQAGNRYSIDRAQNFGIQFHAALGNGIGRERGERGCLTDWEGVRVSIDPTRRGKNDRRYSGVNCRLHYADRTHNVDIRINAGSLH